MLSNRARKIAPIPSWCAGKPFPSLPVQLERPMAEDLLAYLAETESELGAEVEIILNSCIPQTPEASVDIDMSAISQTPRFQRGKRARRSAGGKKHIRQEPKVMALLGHENLSHSSQNSGKLDDFKFTTSPNATSWVSQTTISRPAPLIRPDTSDEMDIVMSSESQQPASTSAFTFTSPPAVHTNGTHFSTSSWSEGFNNMGLKKWYDMELRKDNTWMDSWMDGWSY